MCPVRPVQGVRSQFATLEFGFFPPDAEAEPLRETPGVPTYCLVERLRLDLIQFGEVAVEHDLLVSYALGLGSPRRSWNVQSKPFILQNAAKKRRGLQVAPQPFGVLAYESLCLFQIGRAVHKLHGCLSILFRPFRPILSEPTAPTDRRARTTAGSVLETVPRAVSRESG